MVKGMSLKPIHAIRLRYGIGKEILITYFIMKILKVPVPSGLIGNLQW